MTTGGEGGGGATGSDAAGRLLDAARALLRERGPSEITVRSIAERAGMQHSLITRHYGSRDMLLAVAVAGLLEEVARTIDEAPDLDAAITAGIDAFLADRALSSAVGMLVVQGVTPASGRYPIIDALASKLRAAGSEPDAARETAVAMTALISGWVSAEPWWLQSLGRVDAPDEGRDLLGRAVRALLTRAPGAR